jgi:glycosyltransferase involved in cell wall biosynthesis
MLDRLEPGSIFFDVDSAWNMLTPPRAELLPQLTAGGVRIVEVLCDVMPITDFEWFERNSARRFIDHVEAHATHSDLVLAISEHTADEYGRWAASTGRRVPPVGVVTLGTELPVDVDDLAVPEVPPELRGTRYLLTVGTIEPRKNHAVLFEAYDDLHLDHPEVHLVVVGREGWKSGDVVARLRRHMVSDDHVHWFDAATDGELVALYRSAFAVVTPSLAEGFGLPVVEALGHGCVVLSSDGGALPEAGGDLAQYFDPRRAEDLSKLIRRHLEDPVQHEAQRARVASVVPKQWSTVARETGAALVALATGPEAPGSPAATVETVQGQIDRPDRT